jgi:DNA-directed RNA polymerase subunit RPC12/RpoP
MSKSRLGATKPVSQPPEASQEPAPPSPAEQPEAVETVDVAKAPPAVVSQLKADSDARERLRNRICAECLTPYPGPPAHSVGIYHEGRCPKCGSASFMVSVVS